MGQFLLFFIWLETIRVFLIGQKWGFSLYIKQLALGQISIFFFDEGFGHKLFKQLLTIKYVKERLC